MANPLEILVPNMFRLIRLLRLRRFFNISGSAHPFTYYFKGMENVQAVRDIFGENTESVLNSLIVELTWFGGYMFVNNLDGHLMISAKYLNTGDKIDIYLDLVHELVHVKQYMDGKELFDAHYSYTDRPTEIAAYRAAVKEARRLGLSDERICLYLKTEWMSEKDLHQLATSVNVNCGL